MEGCRVFAQKLRYDTAENVMAQVSLAGNRLTVPEIIMCRVGAPENGESRIPAMVNLLT